MVGALRQASFKKGSEMTLRRHLWLLVAFLPLFAQTQEKDLSVSAQSYSLSSYLAKLTQADLDYKDRTLESKVVLIQSLIEQTRYNPDIYLEGNLFTESTVDVAIASLAPEVQAVGKINLNMRLYDAQRSHYMSQRDALFKQLSEQQLIDAKERLQLMGIEIYSELMQIQKTIEQYKILLKYQKRITDLAITRSGKGLGGIYDKTQAQNDLLNIRLRLTDLKELLIQKEFLFRQSINSDSTGAILLEEMHYAKVSDSLQQLQHAVLEKNAHLNLLKKKYELSTSDIETEASRRGLSLDLRSHYGYGYVEQVSAPNLSDSDQDWYAGLTLKYPLYERNDIDLKVEQKQVQALQSKNSVNIQKRALTRTVNRLYNSIQKYEIKDRLYTQQKEVLLERTTMTYNRFKEALETYKPYSDSVRDMARSDEAFIKNALLLDITTLQLYVLTGRYLDE